MFTGRRSSLSEGVEVPRHLVPRTDRWAGVQAGGKSRDPHRQEGEAERRALWRPCQLFSGSFSEVSVLIAVPCV